MNDLAWSYAALGRHSEAIKLHEEALSLWKVKLGPDNPNVLWAMQSLAVRPCRRRAARRGR